MHSFWLRTDNRFVISTSSEAYLNHDGDSVACETAEETADIAAIIVRRFGGYTYKQNDQIWLLPQPVFHDLRTAEQAGHVGDCYVRGFGWNESIGNYCINRDYPNYCIPYEPNSPFHHALYDPALYAKLTERQVRIKKQRVKRPKLVRSGDLCEVAAEMSREFGLGWSPGSADAAVRMILHYQTVRGFRQTRRMLKHLTVRWQATTKASYTYLAPLVGDRFTSFLAEVSWPKPQPVPVKS